MFDRRKDCPLDLNANGTGAATKMAPSPLRPNISLTRILLRLFVIGYNSIL
jgi:hypothetical protein